MVGEVEDVRPYYQAAWLQVVPLRIGGGTRLKIVESLGMRTSVVSTSLGAQGLNLKDGESIVLADTADTFALEVVKQLQSAENRERMEANGYRDVLNAYRWDVLGAKLSDYLLNI
jgi:glycosyltransferase involved in cell wall biosynthesis